jgi:O-antigen ligase
MPFWVCHRSLALRCFLVGYTALSVVCIGLTGSRSSFVGLLLCALVMILRGRRRLQLALGALLLAPVLWAALPASLQTRFETIINPEVGPANARTSGEGRIQGLLVGLHLWGSNPVTGCGPGCWRAATGRTTESHNLYGQVLGETGSLGALAFAAVVLVLWLNLRRIREAYRLHPDWGPDFLYQVTRAVGLGVLLMLFEGNFGHSLFRYNWVWYGGFLVIAGHCLEQRLQTQAVRRLGRSSSASAFDLRGARGRLVGVISGGIR